MQNRFFHTKEADNKFAALMNARQRSYAESTHYSDSERVRAERVRLACELVYSAGPVYVTYRKKFITVKVSGAGVRDPRALGELEQQWHSQGISKVTSAQGVIYRIAKQ